MTEKLNIESMDIVKEKNYKIRRIIPLYLYRRENRFY